MAGQLQKTYADLEWKVKERTRDLAQSINELKVLEEVGRAVSSSLDLNAVLPTVAARALEITHADAVLIYGYDAAHRTASTSPKRSASTSRPKAAIAPSTEDATMLGEAAANGRADRDPQPRRERRRHAAARCRARGRLPFRAGGAAGRPEGHVWDRWWCCGKMPASFPQNLIGLMKTFAHQAVLAMRNARLFTEVNQKSRELETAHSTVQQQAAKLQEQTRPAQGLEQVAGGPRRDPARRDRAHPQARALPGAAGGAADRLLRRP